MAIGSMHIEWLSSLASRSQIPAGAAVLDLGTQDLWGEPEPLQRVAARHLGPADRERTLTAIFDGKTPRPRCQHDFYSIFGAGSYRSIDLGDPRADFPLDLNLPVPASTGVYDVVTNFGTTEHVFNIGQTFANIHSLLEVDGIQLHTLPAYGYIDHGFYNIHPSVYLDMARANAYDIVDVLYIDNINVRMAHVTHEKPFDFDTLPIQRDDMSDTCALMTKAAKLFQQNLQSADTRAVLEKMAMSPKKSLISTLLRKEDPLPIFLMFDMMFVALRKTSRSPAEFVTPAQSIYSK
jgi:hypothetical protein